LYGLGVGRATIRGKKGGIWGHFESVLGAPGRGVLQKTDGAYRRPVHFLTFLAIFTKNVQI